MAFGLRRMLAPMDLQRFYAEHWARRYHVSHGPVARLHDLMSNPHLRDPQAVIDHLSQLDLEILAWRHGRVPLSRTYPSAQAGRAYEQGDSLYLTRVERFVPGLRELAAALERDLGIEEGAVSVEAFVAQPGRGVSPHYDYDDNFNVQLTGTKEWKVSRQPDVASPMESYFEGRPVGAYHQRYAGGEWPRRMPAEHDTFTAEPGTVVYLPAGTWHSTRCTAPSVAVTFSCRPERWWRRIVAALATELGQHADLRAFGYGVATPPLLPMTSEEDMARAWQRFQALVAGISAREVWALLHKPPPTFGSYHKVPGVRASFVRDGDGGELTLHPPHDPASVWEVAPPLAALIEEVLQGPEEVVPHRLQHHGLHGIALQNALDELVTTGWLTGGKASKV